MNSLAKNKYDLLYKSMGFERSELFELIKQEFNPRSVIYPGCSVHITPSFYFNHVVYIDKNQIASDFFANADMVTDLINKNKRYKETSYWKFISKDFKFDLGLRYASFDLLLSLFAGKLIDYCEQYIKPGGLILTSSLFSDNESIKENDNFVLIGLIKRKKHKYIIDSNSNLSKSNKSKLQPKYNGLEYIDNECYYLYRNISVPLKSKIVL